MPRPVLRATAPKDNQVFEAVNNLAEHGILAVRRKKNGEIKSVKHAVWGWIPAGTFGILSEIKGYAPLIGKVLEGGYRLKEAIWGYTVQAEVLASGVEIPFGLVIVATAVAMYVVDTANNNPTAAFLDLAALALPFGEIWLFYHGLDSFLAAFTGKSGGNILQTYYSTIIQLQEDLLTFGLDRAAQVAVPSFAAAGQQAIKDLVGSL